MTIRYDDEDVSAHAGEERFKLAYLEEKTWKYIKSSSNMEENKVIGKVTHLSEWDASCYGSHKTGIQVFLENLLAQEDQSAAAAQALQEINCVKDFAGPCGFLKLIFLYKSGKPYALEYYHRFINDTYEMEIMPLGTLKEVGPVEEYWFHPGYCRGENDGSPFRHSSCKLSESVGVDCNGYSYDCWYGEDEDGSNKPQYDYTKSIEDAIELINAVHEDKPEYPLFIEIWNEPNLNLEWHDISLTDYEIEQFARYFVEMARAIKELPHSESIKIITPGLAPTTGAKVCELKPSKAKSVVGHVPKLENHWFIRPNIFNSDYCEELGENYVISGKNICTGMPYDYAEPYCGTVCPSQSETQGENCRSPAEIELCVCESKNEYIDYILEWYNAIPHKDNIFSGLDVPSTVSCPNTAVDIELDKAEEIKNRIAETYPEHCFEKITAIDTEEYIRKMLASEYGEEICELMDMYGDHPAPLWGEHETYPGGSYPYGMTAYQRRFSVFQSLCGAEPLDCTEPDLDDSDNDGLKDLDDNCPETPNPEQEDWNDNGIGDVCEDWDEDGINDAQDLCPVDETLQTGPDSDNDGIADECDNCLHLANRDQLDLDLDGIGDACDDHTDNDNIVNPVDNCPYNENPDQHDRDNDGVGDECDNCPQTVNPGQENWNNNELGDACEDSDGDGVYDNEDLCPEVPSETNTQEVCAPIPLCPGKIFITETAYAPPPPLSFNLDEWVGNMACAFKDWYEDENVFAITPFHLGDEDFAYDEFKPYSWTSEINEGECIGKQMYETIKTGEYECAETESEQETRCLEDGLSAVMIGDSITFGFNNYNCLDDETNALRQALSEAGINMNIEFKGVAGEIAALTTVPLFPNNPVVGDRLEQVYGYDVVLLWHGVNQRTSEGVSYYGEAYRQLINELGEEVTVFLMTPIVTCENDELNRFTLIEAEANAIASEFDNVHVIPVGQRMFSEMSGDVTGKCSQWFDMDDPRPVTSASDPDPPYDWVHPYCDPAKSDDAYDFISQLIVPEIQNLICEE